MLFLEEPLRNPGFGWPAALSLASAAKLAYLDRSDLEDRLEQSEGLELSAFLEAGDTQGFVAESDAAMVIAFRGAESLGDWLTNIQIVSTDRAYGPVHRGFHEEYSSVVPQFLELALAAMGSGKLVWLTGHSLGGALATITALEWEAHAEFAGVFTFGQPKLVGDGNAVAGRLERHGYVRFVNDDDIVPRIPPNFEHAGEVMHFDAYGNLRSTDNDEGFEGAGLELPRPDLSMADFESLQQDIASIRQTVAGGRQAPDPALEGTGPNFEATLEGTIVGVEDHRIDNYIDCIRRYVGTRRGMSSEAIETSMLSGDIEFERVVDLGGGPDGLDDVLFADEASERFPLLLEVRASSWEPPEGLQVNSIVGSYATVMATSAQYAELIDDRNVLSIEDSRDAGVYELDRSVPYVQGDAVHRPPIDERGDKAIIGVIDSGIDILHEAFLDDAGKTRILAIWDQRDGTGPTPRKVDADAFTQDYGSLYSQADIQALIDRYRQDPTDKPHARLRDSQWLHGTHVASIAAGRACGDFAGGMAPEAGIIMVMPNMKPEPGFPESIGYSNSHIDALAFIKRLAEGANALVDEAAPVVINVSMGMNAGAHDGKTGLEAAFDVISGMGHEPGCVIVKSAGNERGKGGHTSCMPAQGSLFKVAWESKDIERFEDYIEAWFQEEYKLDFRLVDPQGNETDFISTGPLDNPPLSATLGPNKCTLRLTSLHRDNGQNRLTIRIRPFTEPIQPGTWELHIVAREVVRNGDPVDLWFERVNSRPTRFAKPDEEKTLSIPGTSRTIITVGACNTEDPVMLNDSSSFGPTWDNRSKPEISAPGAAVEAARAGTSNHQATIAMDGTSMAAPHVAGALALVMSNREKQAGARQFSAEQLRSAVKLTARNRAGGYNPGYGFGQLDALELFNRLKQPENLDFVPRGAWALASIGESGDREDGV